ncbi:glycoside hydrolase family 13 protein [Arenibacter amylolyticus]|uniref:glycoside hydrolase family 13 protein n=1 Tax=Arenibacter amylolyticus TaxID=1406873 RepID=UPI001592AF8F
MRYKHFAFCFAILWITSACSTEGKGKSMDPHITEGIGVERVEPPHWWIGFKNRELQLLVKDPDIAKSIPEINEDGISIKKITEGKSPNYLFLDLEFSQDLKPTKFTINFTFQNGLIKTHTYELKGRNGSSEEFVGFNSSDAIYLITPDRFANADPKNDRLPFLREQTVDRNEDYARHGGDIKGITNHLDYIEKMGFTAIWPSPLLTNDMEEQSYHGYAITDFYGVDPRFGSLEDYKELVNKAKEKSIKIIMDQVANHCGLEHWWMKDLPFDDWFNYQGEFENQEIIPHSNHRRTTNQDPYASEQDKKAMTHGWFVDTMPDLNQRNPFMAKYLIQNSIWWIETLGLGGIRQDTYPYPDKEFMAKWAGEIMTEYPQFSIVGEEWSNNPLLIAYWQQGNQNRDGYNSNLRSTMDFAMQNLIIEGIKEEENWNSGLIKMYEGLANDFAYPSPEDIVAFLDNHDMDRVYTQLNENLVDTQMALSYLLVLPRIPQLYYGTEILMQNSKKPGDHGLIRTDFPGGWEGDAVNAFTGENLSTDQKNMQSFLKSLLNYRKESEAIHKGKTIHFAPTNGVYLLSRMYENEIVTLIINKNKDPYTLDLTPYAELGLQGKTLRNVLTNTTHVWKDNIDLSSRGATLLTTKLK